MKLAQDSLAARLPLERPMTTPANRVMYREPRTADELEELYRVRYDVYRDSGYMQPSPDGLDIDSYDLRSHYVGAYLGDRLIGGARLILREGRSPAEPAIRSLLARCRGERLRSLPDPPAEVFSEQAFDFSTLLDRWAQQGRRAVEFGRTVCVPEHRGLGIGFGLVHAIYGLSLTIGVDAGIGTCPVGVKEFYRRLACRPLDSLGTFRYQKDGHDTELVALEVDLRRPCPAVEASRAAALQLVRHGRIVLCTERDCILEHDHSAQRRAARPPRRPARRGTLRTAGH